MNTDTLERKFEKMGAKVAFFENKFRRTRNPGNPSIDIISKGRDETFIIDSNDQDISVEVLDVRPKERHLLLMLKDNLTNENSKFLCGHDERHWFVAAIPESAGAKNVSDAMDALKPPVVKEALKKSRVKNKLKNKRKNPAYIRQGEWFFIPVKDLEVNELLVHKNEPIVRAGGGKPHICEEVYRTGGETVLVNGSMAHTEKEHKAYLKEFPDETKARWNHMTRDALVYARGYVKHPDHSTTYLDGWHRVEPNTENKARAREFMSFLD